MRRTYASRIIAAVTERTGNGNLSDPIINMNFMENYRIYCEEGERAEIMSILRKYNDVVIDNVNTTSFGITIEREDGEQFYKQLLEEIDREVYRNRRERNRVH